MADDKRDPGEDQAGDEQSEPKRRFRLGSRRLVFYVAAPLAAIGLFGGMAMFTGLLSGGEGGDAPAESTEALAARPKVFYELPEMLVNLADHGEARARYLKLQVSLELTDEESKEALEPVLPRVIDLFQVYLRELRSSDLDGSAGIFRLKEELVRRVNLEMYPHEVSDVLFKEIIVQ